jgi:hypothetical protein
VSPLTLRPEGTPMKKKIAIEECWVVMDRKGLFLVVVKGNERSGNWYDHYKLSAQVIDWILRHDYCFDNAYNAAPFDADNIHSEYPDNPNWEEVMSVYWGYDLDKTYEFFDVPIPVKVLKKFDTVRLAKVFIRK